MKAGFLQFLSGGSVFGLVVAVLVGEALLLGTYGLRSGRGIAGADLLGSLGAGLGLAGGALLMAKGAPALAVAACLCVALAAHSLDLCRRWRR